ncbi:hypothetical protein DIPPA_07766 [Diplonema papillatum]|nr:hypothetical protein DIPPA_07766 [Diplonema papillatum]
MSGPEGTDEAVLLPLSPGAGDDGGEAKDRQPPISLSYYASLGFTGTGEGCVEHVADGSVAFLVGRHVALYNYETQRHRFLLKPAKTTEIVTFSVSKNRKYIALAERVADKGTTASEVSIWHIDPKAQDSSPTGIVQC